MPFGKIPLFNFVCRCCNFSTIRQLPKCIYIQPPAQWLRCKLNFQRLKMWDESFDENEFRRGARQVSLVLLDVVRLKDSVQLSKVTTIRGFSQIYRDMMISRSDPRGKFLYFKSEDIFKIIPQTVNIRENSEKCHCIVDIFFMGMKYLDEIVAIYKEDNLQIYQDIKRIEKWKKSSGKIFIPISEKLLFIEGNFRLYSSYTTDGIESDWKIDAFKISQFEFVHYNVDDDE